MQLNRERFDPISRPGLAYQHAFDWLAVRLANTGPAACLAPSTFCAVEMLRRLPELPFLEPLPDGLDPAATALGCRSPGTIDPKEGELAAVAWLEPATKDLERLDDLAQILSPTARLYLIAGGPLARFLAERRTGANGQASLLNDRVAKRTLQQHGFLIKERLGWHGLQAIGFHTLAQVALCLGRRHRRDRFHYAMRRAFGVRGSGRHLVALTCLSAERVT